MAQLCVCVKQPKKQTLVYKELEINLVSKDENRSDTMNATTAIIIAAISFSFYPRQLLA